VFAHSPGTQLSSHKDKNAQFLENIDSAFAMKPASWLLEKLEAGERINIIDLRGSEAFNKSHIKGAVNILLKDLPSYGRRFDKTLPTICVCNGSVQSAYAVMFLHGRGYTRVYNLSGGMSSWEKNGHPLV
jgi:rhodanese-related sulfurtransferase